MPRRRKKKNNDDMTYIEGGAEPAPKKKKKFYQRTWFIVLVAVIVVFALFGTGSSDDSDDSTAVVDETEDVVDTETTDDEDDVQEKEETFGVGDTMVVGNLEYTLNSVSSSKTIGGDYINTDAQEMFLIVNVSIKNNGNDSISVSSNYFKLLKGEKKYDADSSAALYLDDSILYKDVNPESTLTGNVAFDVIQDTIDDKSLQLQVQTGAMGTQKGVFNLYD